MKLNVSSMKDVVAKTKSFLKETRAEAVKVIWPDRKYVTAATIIILLIVFVTGFFVTFLDYFFGKVFSLFMK